ncbi:MAG: hypothetical protein JWP59_3201 [Massilia sp.]|jgi:hypothetical protein|nr:hypothetical protein [Massilia sp.]
MQLKHFTLCAVSLAASAGLVHAQPEQFVQVNSLKQLPPAVQRALGVGNSADSIADRGERFNAGCVVLDATPQKRFLLGAVAADRVVVAIELGGIVHQSQTIEWRREGAEWVKFERKDALRFPKTMQELLQNAVQPANAALA